MNKRTTQEPFPVHRRLLGLDGPDDYAGDEPPGQEFLQGGGAGEIALHREAYLEDYPQWPTLFVFNRPLMVDLLGGARHTVVQSLLQQVRSDFSAIETRLSVLESKIDKLQDDLRNRPVVKNTMLHDLHTETFELVSPIQILLEEYEDETVARFAEIEAFGYGETEPEAIADLKNEIVAIYEDLSASRPEELGKLPHAWLRILNRIIVKRGETKSQLQ